VTGGIREIEFFVQALQIIHAGRQTALRTHSTVGTLERQLFAGIITATRTSPTQPRLTIPAPHHFKDSSTQVAAKPSHPLPPLTS